MGVVTLPTIELFLLLYSLKSGATLVLGWTVLRSFFTLFFFTRVILEAFVDKDARMFIHTEEPTTKDNAYPVYFCSIVIIVAEVLTLVYCSNLIIGIFFQKCNVLPQYLICRFLTWILEVICLFQLSLAHMLLIGWYLGLFFFVVLEFYGFVVVYSFYVETCTSGCLTCKPVCYCKYSCPQTPPICKLSSFRNDRQDSRFGQVNFSQAELNGSQDSQIRYSQAGQIKHSRDGQTNGISSFFAWFKKKDQGNNCDCYSRSLQGLK